MSNSALNVLQEIASEVSAAVANGVMDVKTFAVEAYEYEVQNISAQVMKVTADCVAAAEAEMPDSSGADKLTFAFSNIVSALEKDAVQFASDDVHAAIEAVIKQRNMRLAQAQIAAAADTTTDTSAVPSADVTGDAGAADASAANGNAPAGDETPPAAA